MRKPIERRHEWRFLKTVRILGVFFLMGTATGAWGEYKLRTTPILRLVERGFCGNMDIMNNLWWSSCRDSYIAMELQQRQAERDNEAVAVLNEREKQAVPKRNKRPNSSIPAELFAR